ncbi:MAG TPA: glutamate--tRNA ligase [Patescibacteria group bacterium]|nr:glutamate--tRNA ligase [Patescibacteria group bacterium]
MEKISNVRVRIAPSPTGFPHIGTIYQALFNFAFAKKHGGKFIVRIEDTDRTRFVEGAEEAIFQALDWFGLVEDESPRKGGEFGPYKQSERLSIYHKYAQVLIDEGHAEFVYYKKEEAGQKKDYSKDSEVKVEKNNSVPDQPKSVEDMISNSDKFSDWVVRMKMPKDEEVVVDDELRGKITFNTSEINPQVLLKSDGYPTYHLGVVVDDHLMEISHVLRAEEWLSSLPKHKLLYSYLGWSMPPVFHTATLRNPDKSKLSKRHGHTNVEWYRLEGFLPEAILNYLGLLGWSHPEEKEVFDLAEFIEKFDLKDIRPAPPVFDVVKLMWMNGLYIREKLSLEQLRERLFDFYSTLREVEPYIKNDGVLELAKTRMETLGDFKKLVLWSPEEEVDKNLKADLRGSLEIIEDKNWNKDEIFAVFKNFMSEKQVKMPVLYSMFTGRKHGLPLPDFMAALGKKESIERLSQ